MSTLTFFLSAFSLFFTVIGGPPVSKVSKHFSKNNANLDENYDKILLQIHSECITSSIQAYQQKLFRDYDCILRTPSNSKPIQRMDGIYEFYATIQDGIDSETCINEIIANDDENCLLDISYEVVYYMTDIDYSSDICLNQDLNTNSPCVTVYDNGNLESGCANSDDFWHLSHWSNGFTPNQYYNYLDASQDNDDIIIWILDGGIDTNHVEFNGRDVTRRETSSNDPITWNSHGTHVASIASGNIAGVAKNYKLFDCPICRGQSRSDPSCQGEYIDLCIANVRDYYAANPTKRGVINLSIGGMGGVYRWDMQLAELEALPNTPIVVVSAGNEYDDSQYYAPAGSKYVITVGASDKNYKHASFSNYGDTVEIYAPGVEILAALAIDDTPNSANNFYTRYSGTSMASPVIAGEVALLLARDNNLNRDEIITVLQSRAIPISSCPNGYCKVTTGQCGGTQSPTNAPSPTISPTPFIIPNEYYYDITTDSFSRTYDWANGLYENINPSHGYNGFPAYQQSNDNSLFIFHNACFDIWVLSDAITDSCSISVYAWCFSIELKENAWDIRLCNEWYLANNGIATVNFEYVIPPSTDITESPTNVPTRFPTLYTNVPTELPTNSPTSPEPTFTPTTSEPTMIPTDQPSISPTTPDPTSSPVSLNPTSSPTISSVCCTYATNPGWEDQCNNSWGGSQSNCEKRRGREQRCIWRC